jgi:uncharacterized tellurite resistance protein B-like protein
MFNKIFKKKEEKFKDNNNILITALLIHSAKIDESYTAIEKNIIKKAIIKLNLTSADKVDALFNEAEKKENEANQIVEFTKEIKKKPMEFRLKVIEILWEIVYSDGTNDNYESNLIRRVCGLLYVSDKDSGTIKLQVKKLVK